MAVLLVILQYTIFCHFFGEQPGMPYSQGCQSKFRGGGWLAATESESYVTAAAGDALMRPLAGGISTCE